MVIKKYTKGLKVKRGSTYEKIGLLVTGIFGVMLWILMNKLILFGIDYRVTWIPGITTRIIDLFWFALVLFHIGLMFLMTRHVIKDNQKDYLDFVFGLVATFGVFFILSTAISGIYFGLDKPITWFFMIPSITLFRVGFILETIAILYFAFIE